MSCKNTIIYKQLLDVYKEEKLAKERYDWLTSPKFLQLFGDWTEGENREIDPSSNRTNNDEDNTPRLFSESKMGKTINYFLDRYENRIDVTPRNFEYLNIENRTTKINEVVNSISNIIFLENIKENFNDLSLIENIDIDSYIDSFLNNLEKRELEGDANDIKQLKNLSEEVLQTVGYSKEKVQVLEMMSDERLRIINGLRKGKLELKEEIKNFFRNKGLDINDQVDTLDSEDLDDNSDRGEKENSVEQNTKDKASTNVKLMLSFIPSYETNPSFGANIQSNRFQESSTSTFSSQKLMSGDIVHENLLKDLADIVTLKVPTGVTDLFESMKAILAENQYNKPYYKDVLQIVNSVDQNKQNEFVSAMMHSRYSHLVSENDLVDNVFKTFDAAKQTSIESKITKNWQERFNAKFFNDESKLDTSEIDYLYTYSKKTKNIVDTIFSTGSKLDELTDDQFANKIVRALFRGEHNILGVFKQMGIENITSNVIYSQIFNVEPDLNTIDFRKAVKTNIQNLNDSIIKSVNDLRSNKNNDNYKFIDNNKSWLFNDLAVYTAMSENDIKDSTVYSMNKMFWSYGNPSYISNMVSIFKQDPNSLRELKKDPINKHSLWVDYLLAEETDDQGEYLMYKDDREKESAKRLDEFFVGRMLQYQTKQNISEATDNKKISPVDQTIDRVNKVMKGGVKNAAGTLTKSTPSIYATIVPADKSTSFEISINHFIDETMESMENVDNIQFSNKVKNILFNYFTDEYSRMVNAYKVIQEFEALPEEEKPEAFKNLNVHYHVNPKGINIDPNNYRNNTYGIRKDNKKDGELLGQAFVSQIMTDINYNSLNNALAKGNIFRNDNSPKFPQGLNKDQEKVIKDKINSMLQQRVVDNVGKLMAQGIIKKDKNGYTMNTIDKDVKKTYNAENGNFTQPSLYHLVSDYTINTIIANVEYTKLFTGDPAYYKNMVDFFKRVPATYTDGTQLRLGIEGTNDATFNMVVVENQIVGSNFYNELKDSLKLTNSDITEEEINDIIGAYENGINQTDAQAWITPNRWKFILERTGKWSKAHDVVYDKMLEKNTEPFTAKELKLSAQPLKGVYFGVVQGVPTYMKYSQAVLSPMLVKGSKLQTLYDAMEKQNIDEAVTLDGVKVGAKVPTNISRDNIDFNIQRLNNSEWKLQQDLPVKLMKQTLLGSQIQKNIYSTIQLDEQYDIEGTTMTGSEMILHINDIISTMSNKAIDNLSVTLGMDNNGKIDKDQLYKIAEDEINDNPDQYTNNVKDAIRKQIPFEAIPGLKDKIYSIVFSKIRKSASNIKTNGGSFIQMSNYGLDQVTADEAGVTWLVEPNELRPPTLYQDKDGNIKQRPGQIFISHSDIAKAIPNYRELAKKGKLKSMLDNDILKAIGYRIPNQGMSSNDALDIVGILPPYMNDTIVAYTEITTKTGSDFDIDKMYVMLPEIKTLYNKRTYGQAKKYLNSILRNDDVDLNNVDSLNEFYEDLLEQTGIELNTEELTKLLLSSDEYLVSDNYFQIIVDNIVKGDSILSEKFEEQYEIGEINKIVKTKSNKDSKAGMNNMLFDAYWSILTNKSTYTDLIKPIDFDYLQNHIKSLNETQDLNENFKFYDGLYQLQLKNTYTLGKSGVGISANHAVDHNISKNGVNLTFNGYYLGVGFENSMGETVFDRNPSTMSSNSVELTTEEAKEAAERINKGRKQEDKVNYKTLKSFKIGDTISAFMNAFVDNTKDPYIEKGNYDTYTSAVAFMLTRAGVHPYWTDAFIGQPILKELTAYIKDYESQSIEKNPAFKGMSGFDIILAREVSELINNKSKSAINKKLADIKKRKLEVYTYSDLINTYDNDSSNEKNIQILLKFKEFQDQAKKLDASVNLSRFDTLGSGRNFVDMLVYRNNLLNILNKQSEKNEIRNHYNKYIKNGVYTSLGTQLNNSVIYANDLLEDNSQIFLSANSSFLNVINNISMNTASSYGGSMGRSTNKDMIGKISKDIYTAFMSKYPLFQVEENPLVFIKKVKSDLFNYKNSQDKKFPNAFIEAITFYENSFGLDIGRIPIETKNNISNSFYDIYRKDKKLAKNVIKASFLMTGFNQSLIDFNEMIPHEFFLENHRMPNGGYMSVQEFIRQELLKVNNAAYMSSFHKEYAQNNVEDNVIVPSISESYLQKIKGSKNLFKISNSNILSSYKLAERRNYKGEVIEEETSYTAFLKTSEPIVSDDEMDYLAAFDDFIEEEVYNPLLFEYMGNIEENGEISPLYKRIEKKGYRDRTSKVHYKEYNVEESKFRDNRESVIEGNDNLDKLPSQYTLYENYKLAEYGEKESYRGSEGLKRYISELNRNESEETSVSEENVVSLQNEDIYVSSIHDKIDGNAYNIALEYKGVEYDMVISRDGEIIDPTYVEGTKEKNADPRMFKISKEKLNSIFKQLDTFEQESNNPLDCN